MTPEPRRYVLTVRSTGQRATDAELDVLARDARLHPDLVRRLIALGALETPSETTTAAPSDSAARLVRIVRLRTDLGLNYAGALLAVDLLTRIDDLEALLSRHTRHRR